MYRKAALTASLVLLALAACDTESSNDKDAAADTTTTGTDAAGGADAQDVLTTDTPDSGCFKTGRFGDGLFGTDMCWAPPQHYCSAGGGSAIVKGCAADQSFCCEFPTTCLPCGWVSCLDQPTSPACTQAPLAGDSAACAAVMTTAEPICLD